MIALLWILLLSSVALGGLRLLMPPRLRPILGVPEFAAVLLLPIVAMLSPTYLVFALAVVAILAALPELGGNRISAGERRLRLLFFAVPLLPMLQFTVMIGPYTIVQLTYFTLICLGTLSALMISGTEGSGGPSRLAPWDLTFAAMMAVQLFMDARSSDVMFTLRSIVQVLVNLGLPYLLFSRAMAGVRDPAALLIGLLLASSAIGLIAVFESVDHWLLYDAIVSRIGADLNGVSGYTKLRGGMLRAGATFPESTGLSLYLGVALTMVFALRRQLASRALVTVMAAMLFAGLVCTFARVGYIALGVGLSMCLLHERRFGSLLAMLVVLPVVGLLVIAFGSHVSIVAASIGTGTDSSGSIDYRGMLYAAGLRLVGEHPLFGLSMTSLMGELSYLRQGEGIVDLVNQPLTIAMRAGLLGGALYFLMMARVLIALFLGRRSMDSATQACACACFAALIALMAALTTTSFGRNETTFILLLGMGAGLATRSFASSARVQRVTSSKPRSATQPAAAPASATPSIIISSPMRSSPLR